MESSEKMLNTIYGAIDDYNMDMPPSDQLDKSPDTILFADGGKLDSVGFITMSTAIEARMQKDLGVVLPVFTQEASLRPDKPLATVRSLALYLAQKIGS